MTESFYNTVNATGSTLNRFEARAASQQAIVFDYFERRPGLSFSPSQVQRALGLTSVPLTSIRRAITTLTTDGLLRRTGRQVEGPYGRPEYCWTLRRRSDIVEQRELL